MGEPLSTSEPVPANARMPARDPIRQPGALNIASYSEDWRASTLSTFAHTPFVLPCGADTVRCASVEGFWQGLKWPEGSAERDRIFGLWGLEAKLAGQGAPATTHVRFAGRDVPIGSPEHHALAEQAMRAKLAQNPTVQQALDATDALLLTHVLVDDQGHVLPDSRTLPAAVFCAIWTRLREERRRPTAPSRPPPTRSDSPAS